jgi:hypothetical protein
MNNLKAHCITIPACAGMTILVLESADLSLVESIYFRLINFNKSSTTLRLTSTVLNLMTLTALDNREKESDQKAIGSEAYLLPR